MQTLATILIWAFGARERVSVLWDGTRLLVGPHYVPTKDNKPLASLQQADDAIEALWSAKRFDLQWVPEDDKTTPGVVYSAPIMPPKPARCNPRDAISSVGKAASPDANVNTELLAACKAAEVLIHKLITVHASEISAATKQSLDPWCVSRQLLVVIDAAERTP